MGRGRCEVCGRAGAVRRGMGRGRCEVCGKAGGKDG
jgi:hypothetical protein